MKLKKLIPGLLLLAGVGVMQARAQQGTDAAGGEATGSGGTVSYSVGQVDYTFLNGSAGSANLGVQQPYEFFVTGIEQTPGISLQVSAFPNPVSSVLNLKIDGSQEFEGMSYRLSDITGKELESHPVNARLSELPMQNFESGTYLLSVFENGKPVQSFTIIKNK